MEEALRRRTADLCRLIEVKSEVELLALHTSGPLADPPRGRGSADTQAKPEEGEVDESLAVPGGPPRLLAPPTPRGNAGSRGSADTQAPKVKPKRPRQQQQVRSHFGSIHFGLTAFLVTQLEFLTSAFAAALSALAPCTASFC